jgi:hypothetical protein
VFPVAWIIQRHSGYTAAVVFLLPIFVVILALTKPDYGAEFWSIFRHEAYLNPVYMPRGFLVYFLLLSPVIFTRIVVNKDDPWSGDKIPTLVLCFLIGFAVTSWEALITPAPPRGWLDRYAGGQSYTYEGWSDRSAGQWTEMIWEGWLIISRYIRQYIPPDYQNAVRIGVSIYLFLACFLLLFPTYRKLPKDFIRDFMWEYREVFFLSFGGSSCRSFWLGLLLIFYSPG